MIKASQKEILYDFLSKETQMIVKPINGFGGQGIFLLNQKNLYRSMLKIQIILLVNII